jgi:hypothetical protein
MYVAAYTVLRLMCLQVSIQIFYPINNTDIGGGSKKDVVFHANSKGKEWDFPFAIEYKMSSDPNKKILIDLLTKCGILGGNKSKISVDYKITLGLRILFITISPVVSNSFGFDCPITSSDISVSIRYHSLSILFSLAPVRIYSRTQAST